MCVVSARVCGECPCVWCVYVCVVSARVCGVCTCRVSVCACVHAVCLCVYVCVCVCAHASSYACFQACTCLWHVWDVAVSPPIAAHSPHSEMAPDQLQSYKAWKRAIMLVWRQIAQHKYANLFLQPVKDEEATGYSEVVHR